MPTRISPSNSRITKPSLDRSLPTAINQSTYMTILGAPTIAANSGSTNHSMYTLQFHHHCHNRLTYYCKHTVINSNTQFIRLIRV